MKRILMSLSVIGVAAAVVIGGTSAFFSDTETSVGNTFTAGAIDLQIDNESYYLMDEDGMMIPSEETTWETAADLDDGNGPSTNNAYLFFDFHDLKPGDIGEDTISLTVQNNDAWACMDFDITSTPENGQNEPEAAVDPTDGDQEGELQNEVNFVWWVDDGDNVLETDEAEGANIISNTSLADLDELGVAIADASENSLHDGPLPGTETFYVGKAWCYGDLTLTPKAEGEGGPDTRGPGVSCDGSNVSNASQGDGVTADIMFTAIQSRNNADFRCDARGEEGGDDIVVATGESWAPNAATQEWLAKVKVQEPNPAADFEMQVGVGDSNPADFSQGDTEYVDEAENSFTLSYDSGTGIATLTVDGHGSVQYPVGTGPYSGNIGITLRAPSDATTYVDSLMLNGSVLSTDNASVSNGTSHIYVTGADMTSNWNMTGTFTFDWDTLTSNGENQKVQISIN